MSFDYGLGDLVTLGRLAWSVYKSCKDAPGSFNNISVEVLSLHAVLKEVEESLSGHELSHQRQENLEAITRGCKAILEDLQALVKKYESLGTKSKRTWDRLRWGNNDIVELRSRLTSNTVLLTAFMSTLQVTVEKKLDCLIQDFRDGRHEDSVISTMTVQILELDQQEAWRAIRKELEDIGISVAAFEENKPFIMSWFQRAVETGKFEEQAEDSDSGLELSRSSTPRLILSAHDRDTSPEDFQSRRTSEIPSSIPPEFSSLVESPVSSDQLAPGYSTEPPVCNRPKENTLPDENNSRIQVPNTIENKTTALTIPGSFTTSAYDLHQDTTTAPIDSLPSAKQKIPQPLARKTAVSNKHAWKFAYLLKNTVTQSRPSIFGWEWGLRDGYISKLDEEFSRGIDVDVIYYPVGTLYHPKNLTALQRAALGVNHDVIQWLAAHGADLERRYEGERTQDPKFEDQWTPLMAACTHFTRLHPEVLIQYGADVNAIAKDGKTVLMVAVEHYDWGTVDTLLNNGAVIESTDSRGHTAQMRAVDCRNPEGVSQLVEWGANVNYKVPLGPKDAGMTLLMIAARNDDGAMIKLLLDFGACIHASDFNGSSPLLIAVYYAGNHQGVGFCYGGQNYPYTFRTRCRHQRTQLFWLYPTDDRCNERSVDNHEISARARSRYEHCQYTTLRPRRVSCA